MFYKYILNIKGQCLNNNNKVHAYFRLEGLYD